MYTTIILVSESMFVEKYQIKMLPERLHKSDSSILTLEFICNVLLKRSNCIQIYQMHSHCFFLPPKAASAVLRIYELFTVGPYSEKWRHLLHGGDHPQLFEVQATIPSRFELLKLQ